MKRAIGNAVLVLVSLMVGLLLCEVAARLLLNPADYLSVRTITDDVLGIRIEPGAPGFDELGLSQCRPFHREPTSSLSATRTRMATTPR